jgi:hypothetical protein
MNVEVILHSILDIRYLMLIQNSLSLALVRTNRHASYQGLLNSIFIAVGFSQRLMVNKGK